VYRMLDVEDFIRSLAVEATYGVDAELTERTTGMGIEETKFGEIYANLDTKFGIDNRLDDDFHVNVSAKPGSGPEYSFESKFGYIYKEAGQ
jgi:hypothetical protein